MSSKSITQLAFSQDLSETNPVFPQTRYQGSKLKLIDWIRLAVEDLKFDSALDAFGGTGVVSYLFKQMGKAVTYNDNLKFNYQIGLGLIENDNTRLSQDEIDSILTPRDQVTYPTFIADNFQDIFFTDEENRWLDIVVANIREFSRQSNDRYKTALAFFALYQAAIIKRPYNLFHRKNLYMRTAEVKRSFGNKITWDKPFEYWFRFFAEEANRAVFSNSRQCNALCMDVFDIPGNYDLVYIDPPYVSPNGVGVDYLEFYNFLEGITDYDNWPTRINYKTKHHSLKHQKSEWTDKKKIVDAFDRLFAKFQNSILVVSYRDPGIPTNEQLIGLLNKYKTSVIEVNHTRYKYALSNGDSSEQLLIAR